MDWGQLKVRERELQETKIEASAIEGNDDGVFLEAIRQILEVLTVDEHFVPGTVTKANHGHRYEVFIDGQNLQDLPDRLKKYSVVVTFNGAGFDLRFLKIAFPDLEL